MHGIVIWGVAALLGGIAGAILAGYKNRDYSAWAAWCFLFPPLIIALLLTPKHVGPRPRQKKLDEHDRELF